MRRSSTGTYRHSPRSAAAILFFALLSTAEPVWANDDVTTDAFLNDRGCTGVTKEAEALGAAGGSRPKHLPAKDYLSQYEPELAMARIRDARALGAANLAQDLDQYLDGAAEVFSNAIFSALEFRRGYNRDAAIRFAVIHDREENFRSRLERGYRIYNVEYYHYPSSEPLPKYSVSLPVYEMDESLRLDFLAKVSASTVLSPAVKTRIEATAGFDLRPFVEKGRFKRGRFPAYFNDEAEAREIIRIIKELIP